MSTDMPGNRIVKRRKTPRPFASRVAWLTAIVLAATPAIAAQPAIAKPAAPAVHGQPTPSVHGTPMVGRPRPAQLTHGPAQTARAQAHWPTPGIATVKLASRDRPDAAGSNGTAPSARAGSLPVWVYPSRRTVGVQATTVRISDHASNPEAWKNALLLKVNRSDGNPGSDQVRLSVDYSGFATAFGADYANRLRLIQVPDCALQNAELASCVTAPLATINDPAAKTVSADVRLAAFSAATTLALEGGPTSTTGSFAATSLSPSSSWTAGGNAGDFSWQYPMRTPPALGGPVPNLSLSYSSASVDGRNATTNNQPNWIGEGFDYWPGYISRAYEACLDDQNSGSNNTRDTADECWKTDNAVLAMPGHSGELIRDDATGVWRLKNDDNTKIERLTNTVNAAWDHEYWKLTTSDGVQYFFGLNRPPGYSGTAPANKTTNSVWTVPVAGNDPDEPCHASAFTASFCDQPWRWNLDYVVDTHGNTLSVFYGTEANHYARNNTDTDVQAYIRGGWVDHIDYGTDNRSGTDTEQTSTRAPMTVVFGTDNRCLASCVDHANWPDTPFDQECTSSTNCQGVYAPTFWTTKRLKTVATRVWNPTIADYKDVDQWTLTHTFPPSGDETRNGMWLASIQNTGKATGVAVSGSAITLPSTNFDWVQMPNRVDPGTDHKPAMNWMRLSTIWTDTGGKISIAYTNKDCAAGDVPTDPANNTRRCYPVLEEQSDKSINTEYFHKYLVSQVTQEDWSCDSKQTPCSDDVTTAYTYVGSPGWRHADDDGLTKAKLRTWSDFRGYKQVNTQVGDPNEDQQTLIESTFFQGLNGDSDGSGGTRTVNLPALDLDGDGNTTGAADAPAVSDEDAYSGMTRQTTVFNGVESAPMSTTASQPWQSGATATRGTGQSAVTARHSGTIGSWTATKIASGGWRVSRTTATLDGYGMATQVDDQGDLAAPDDQRCIRSIYNRNSTANLLQLVGEVDTYALTCTQVTSPGPTGEADIINMSRFLFDHLPAGTPPTKGEPTQTDVAKAWSNGTPSWLTNSTASYDPYGRPLDTTDLRGNHTTVIYTPTTGGPTTQTATTTVMGTTTTTIEPSWGTTTATVDFNNKHLDVTYDALGRVYQTWLPNHLKASFPSQPSSYYSYLVRATGGPNAITSNTLNAAGNYNTSIAFYDGLLRGRQTQTLSAASGHVGTVFSDTLYDQAGRPFQQSAFFDESVQPSTTAFGILAWQPRTQTVTQYDRVGRTTAQIVNTQGAEKWRTNTNYGGDRVSVTPPLGGTATTVIADAQGRTTELRQYHNAADVGSDIRSLYDLATYHYNKKGQEDQVTDNAGNRWSYTHDLLGRITATHDPDKGDSTTSFNDIGDLLTTTDARGQTLAFTYDAIGRKTAEYTPDTSGTKLASWAYDPTGAKGQLSSASRWIGTNELKMKVNGYTALYQPTSETYTIPAITGVTDGVSGTYTFSHSFNVDGSPATQSFPSGGGLGGETLTYTYDTTSGKPLTLKTNLPSTGQYVTEADYTAYGELSYYSLQATGTGYLHRTFKYEDDTRRLHEAITDRQTAPQTIDDVQYKYDPAGNLVKNIDTSAAGTVDTQCFGYDYADRLADAWTPQSGDCDQGKSASALGGPAPYWLSWTFDAASNRYTQVSHASAGNTTATSSYPNSGPSSIQPHAVTSITTSGPATNKTDSYTYDPIGDTKNRPGQTASQNLAWDVEGHLQQVNEGAKTTKYVYDAYGSRLIQDDTATRTLYLPGEEITYNKSTTTTTATRYYTWAGQTIACITTGGQLNWMLSDPQGTEQLSVASGSQVATQRRQTPFGTARGTNPAWPDPRGFVGGTNDPTGLVHEGAREYDPNLGRFISVDPVFDRVNPQSWNGYAYADQTPTTKVDPSGLYACDEGTDCRTGKPKTTNTGTGTGTGTKTSQSCPLHDCGIQVTPSDTPQWPAAVLFYTALDDLADYGETGSGNMSMNAWNTIILSHVTVEVTDNETGESKMEDRVLLISKSKMSQQLKSVLTKNGIAFIEGDGAADVIEGGVDYKATTGKGHPENIAEELRADPALQKRLLGGVITKVHSVIVSNRFCGAGCAKALSRFIGEDNVELEEVDAGYINGKIMNPEFMSKYGSSGKRAFTAAANYIFNRTPIAGRGGLKAMFEEPANDGEGGVDFGSGEVPESPEDELP
jgi:RHS repeat-associated protein